MKLTAADIEEINAKRASRKQPPTAEKPRKAGPLFKVLWFRVVLDEASGNIRNHLTDNAKACFRLHASRRWCLTGTPIENSVMDLFGVFKFLKLRCVA